MKYKLTTIDYNDIPQFEKFLSRLEQEYDELQNIQDYSKEIDEYTSKINNLNCKNNILLKRLEYSNINIP